MAEKLDDEIKAKLGNCFRVKNVEKGKGDPNLTRFQKEVYILVHVKREIDDAPIMLLMTETEFRNFSGVDLPDSITKFFEKGKLYPMTIGNGNQRYVVKLQDLDRQEVLLSIGEETCRHLEERADDHPESIVELSKGILSSIFG